ncbi:MAG: hypothetical protein ISS78_05445 [Phycisphaerae bacterium]|nr:hypothetical protein [Phycisphaerae bacterium]
MTEATAIGQRQAPRQGRAVIVGNGSSVDAMPPAFWRDCGRHDVMLIGTNRVLCFASPAGAAFDVLVIRDTYRNLWHDQRIGARYHDELWKPHAAWKVGPADRRVTHCDQFVRQAGEWQFESAPDANGEIAVMKNSSVVLMAANWAYLQGAREIALVGVDYHGRHATMVDPYGAQSPGWEGQYDRPVHESIERQFAAAVAAIQSQGGRMVNLSPNTRLGAVPKVEWSSASQAPPLNNTRETNTTLRTDASFSG